MRSDGTLEVVEIRDRRATRYVVKDDGTTASDGMVPLSFSYRSGQRVAFVGWGLCLLGILAGGLADKPIIGATAFIVGAALFVGGGAAYSRGLDFDKRLDGGGWHEPTDLHGWVPRSAGQLAAVEQIADDHDGLVYVRDTGGRILDVYGMRRDKLVLHWVDETGHSGVTSTEAHTGRHNLDRALKWCAMALSLGVLAVSVFTPGLSVQLRIELVGLLVGALVLVIVVGSRNAKWVELDGLMKRRVHDAAEWIEIRTRLVEDAGD
jgi:hypothetical protein